MGVKIDLYKCDICGKEFDNFSKYGGHRSGHARFGLKRKNECGEKIGKRIYTSVCQNCGGKAKKGNKYCSRGCQVSMSKKSGRRSGFVEK